MKVLSYNSNSSYYKFNLEPSNSSFCFMDLRFSNTSLCSESINFSLSCNCLRNASSFWLINPFLTACSPWSPLTSHKSSKFPLVRISMASALSSFSTGLYLFSRNASYSESYESFEWFLSPFFNRFIDSISCLVLESYFRIKLF